MRSRPSLVVAAVASAIWGAAAALAASERRRRMDVAAEESGDASATVSVVVPARDEERDIARTVRSLLEQTHSQLELLVVDDRSRDATAERARLAIGDDPRGRLHAGSEPPSGWLGKPWACRQGVRETRGDWLLFSDADIRHEPTALGRALGLAQREGLAGVSLAPRLRAETLAERVVLPAALTVISTFIAPGPLVRSPRTSIAISVGGWTLIRRSAYERIGGHEAVRDRVAEDVQLARNAKAAGSPILLADGTRLASLRMYSGLSGLWRGWSKNAAFGVEGGPWAALGAALALGALALAPPAATVAGITAGRGRLATIGALGWCAQVALHLQSRPAVETNPGLAPAFPLGMGFLAAVATRASLWRITGRGTVWRGRRYPIAR